VLKPVWLGVDLKDRTGGQVIRNRVYRVAVKMGKYVNVGVVNYSIPLALLIKLFFKPQKK